MKRRTRKSIAPAPKSKPVSALQKVGKHCVIHSDFLGFSEEQRADRIPCEVKIVALRECAPGPDCDNAREAHAYWLRNIATSPMFLPNQENLYAVMLSTRRRVIGHCLVGLGVLDKVYVHPRELFRAAIVASAHAVIVMHNHPSGDPTPSDTDVSVTKGLIRAGQLLKIDVLDHVIVGRGFASLRELGQFYV